MEQIFEERRSLPVRRHCEVLVVGGGIAGIAAALAAARGGKRVLLVEREYALGGMATLGLVTIYLPLCDGAGHQLCFGIAEELLKMSIEQGAEANYPAAWLEGGSLEARIRQRYMVQFNPHLFAMRAEQMLTEAGAEILYGSVLCDVLVKDGRITYAVIENKSGRSAIEAERFIDCSGDADLAWHAGAPTALHEGGNGLAGWYYYQSGGKVALKMFGLADVAPGTPRKPSGKADGEFRSVKVASLDEGFRFSGVDGEELSRSVLAVHGKMYEDILARRGADESLLARHHVRDPLSAHVPPPLRGLHHGRERGAGELSRLHRHDRGLAEPWPGLRAPLPQPVLPGDPESLSGGAEHLRDGPDVGHHAGDPRLRRHRRGCRHGCSPGQRLLFVGRSRPAGKAAGKRAKGASQRSILNPFLIASPSATDD